MWRAVPCSRAASCSRHGTSRSPRVRLLLSALVGLLPGTLSSRIEGDHMQVHVLDERLAWQPTVAELERWLERLLGGLERR